MTGHTLPTNQPTNLPTLPVLNQNRIPLSPTKASRARRWLESGKAVKTCHDGRPAVQLTGHQDLQNHEPKHEPKHEPNSNAHSVTHQAPPAPDNMVAGHINAADMLRLGFTPGLTWRLFGQPAISNTPQPFPKQLQHHYYPLEAVRQVFGTKRFQILRLWESLRLAKIQKEQDLKLQAVLNWAETVPVNTDFPNLTIGEITDLGIAERLSWESFENYPYQPDTAPPEILERWAYTYLKHARTNYDELCDRLRNQPFGRYGYSTILHRVNTLILDSYPFTISLRGDTDSPIRTCRRCGTQQQGHHNGHYWVKPTNWYSRARNNSSNSVHDFCSRSCAGAYAQGHPAPHPAHELVNYMHHIQDNQETHLTENTALYRDTWGKTFSSLRELAQYGLDSPGPLLGGIECSAAQYTFSVFDHDTGLWLNPTAQQALDLIRLVAESGRCCQGLGDDCWARRQAE